jgi:hypothetical protein
MSPPLSPIDAAPPASAPTPAPAPAARSRPKLDLSALGGGAGERKKGRSLLGLLVGTLNKAQAEDRARAASGAAQKRARIDARLQSRLRAEAEGGRRAEDAKKERGAAQRRADEVGVRASVVRAVLHTLRGARR